MSAGRDAATGPDRKIRGEAGGQKPPAAISKRSLRRERRREFWQKVRDDNPLREIVCWLTPPLGHEGVYVERVRGLLYETVCVGCGKTVNGFAKWGTGGHDA